MFRFIYIFFIVSFAMMSEISTNMVDNSATKSFWDGVSHQYGDNEMTIHESDFEMNQVLNDINRNFIPDVLACFGVADGTRDPIMILKKIKKMTINSPSALLINDISDEMLNVAKNKIESSVMYDTNSKEFSMLPGPIEKLKHNSISHDGLNVLYAIGVYSAKFLKDAFELYSRNANIIGTQFVVFPTYYVDGEIIKGNKHISFDINIYEKICDETDILKWQSEYDFLAYSLFTEKNFVSHYFSASTLINLISYIFDDSDIDMVVGNGNNLRYIIIKIFNRMYMKTNVLVTMLNNVLGNVIWDNQISALCALKSLFIKKIDK